MLVVHIFLTVFAVLMSVLVSEGTSNDWQYLVFAQQWPATVCLSQKKHKCQIPSVVSSWTVHGIWPTSKHNYPSFCNESLTFNASVIKPIEDRLLIAWPNLFTDENIYSFWKHEWLKHGTCAVSTPKLDTELKYFTAAITAHNLYDILNFLKEDNIIPDEEKVYSMEHLHTALESKIGKKIAFKCSDVKGFDFPLISTVFICLDKDFSLIDCEQKDRSCKSSIWYLPLRPTKLHYYMNFRHEQHYINFLPTICYVIAGLVLLLTAMIFVWLFNSLKRNPERKMYVVLN